MGCYYNTTFFKSFKFSHNVFLFNTYTKGYSSKNYIIFISLLSLARNEEKSNDSKGFPHEPKILFLDEPTAGVDVELRKTLWENLNDLKKSGVTIFLTTHYIEEAEQLADRVAVINRGKIVVVDKTSKLLEKLVKQTLKILIKKRIMV